MSVDIEKNKAEFLSVLRSEVKRDGLEALIGWLEESDFFTAPASTKYHGAYAGGLCEHSLDVYRFALRLAELYEGELSREELTVASLLHDLCKVNFYKAEYHTQKVDGVRVKVPFYTVDEQFVYGGHGAKSVFLCERHMRLTPNEAVAINSHMGMAPGGDAVRDSARAYAACPLAWIIHAADEASCYLIKR